MKRPLLITDCDEVLLHMVTHFQQWLDETHDVHFDFESGRFGEAMRAKASGEPVSPDRIWPLLEEFFLREPHRQTLVPGAIEALGRIGEVADIVILTNIGTGDHHWRVEQLARHGIRHEVVGNSGGKGEPARNIRERYGAGATVFVDDLAIHHASVAKHAPDILRLHMVAEPRLAPVIPPAEHAHARIDEWNEATGWILERLI